MARVAVWGDPNEQSSKEGSGGGRLPEGWYDLQIEKVEDKPSKVKGTPQLMVSCTILSSPDGKRNGGKATVFISRHEKMAWLNRNFCEAAGVNYWYETGPNGERGIVYDTDDLLGAAVRGYCEHTEWNGKKREEWSQWQASAYDRRQARAPQQPQPAAQQPQAQQPQGPVPGQGAAPPPAQPQQPPQPQQQAPQPAAPQQAPQPQQPQQPYPPQGVPPQGMPPQQGQG